MVIFHGYVKQPDGIYIHIHIIVWHISYGMVWFFSWDGIGWHGMVWYGMVRISVNIIIYIYTVHTCISSYIYMGTHVRMYTHTPNQLTEGGKMFHIKDFKHHF